MSMLKSW